MSYIKSFTKIKSTEITLVGGKGLNLAKLAQADFPVPPGFVVSTEAFDAYTKTGVPKDFADELLSAFKELNVELVSVRSSAIAEDSESASWAGQMETYLNISSDDLIENIEKCWQSTQSARVKEYAGKQNIQEKDLKVAVVVQAMIQSEVSGVMFTVNPLTGDESQIMIESAFGLGEMVVQAEVTPDSYIYDKTTKNIISRDIANKEKKMVYKDGQNLIVELDETDGELPTLADEQAAELAKLGLRVHEYYKSPQDTEWAFCQSKFYLLQSRPITTLKVVSTDNHTGSVDEDLVVTSGVGASAGVATGKARLINDIAELSKLSDGEILVTHKTTPDYVEAFSKACAVVAESGGATSHAAIVSRELGVPAVVGTKDAMSKIKTGDLLTVDGSGGWVYSGEVDIDQEKGKKDFVIPQPSGDDIQDMIDSITEGINDQNELWPIGPVQLMTYIDTDQSMDMYMKLKQLFDEGKTDEEIASLFKRPVFIKTFLLNTGILGIKGANVYEKRATLKDQIQFVTWMLRILKVLNQNDDHYIGSRNYLWNSSEVKDFVEDTEWLPTDNSLKKALNVLSVNLLALNWALFWDYFPETGHELHGPYKVSKFGENSHLVVKDYFNMSSIEVWETAKDIPFKEVRLSQIYDTDKMFINFGNRMIGEDLVAHNSRFALTVDGRRVTSLKEIQKISLELKDLADMQSKYVKSLEPMEIVRKGAKITYFARKNFYEYFSDKWYPEDMVEGTIKAIGTKFIDMKDEAKPMSMDAKRETWDPRNELLP